MKNIDYRPDKQLSEHKLQALANSRKLSNISSGTQYLFIWQA